MRTPFVVLLGTGTPNAEPFRSGPSVAVVGSEGALVVDCGPGTVRRAAAASAEGIPELRPASLSTVLLTHLHSDHTLGLPDLIFTPWVLGRNDVLEVIGPAGTRRMVGLLLDAYEDDIRERTDGLQPSGPSGPEVMVTELEGETSFMSRGIQVTAIPVRHGSLPSFAYRFSAEGRRIAVSGDTAPFPELADFYSGCHILVHEVYSARGLDSRPEEWRRYHRSVHTSAPELADIAGTAGPGHLVLYHQLLNGLGEEDLMKEIEEHYEGRVSYGRDLEVYD